MVNDTKDDMNNKTNRQKKNGWLAKSKMQLKSHLIQIFQI